MQSTYVQVRAVAHAATVCGVPLGLMIGLAQSWKVTQYSCMMLCGNHATVDVAVSLELSSAQDRYIAASSPVIIYPSTGPEHSMFRTHYSSEALPG